MLNVPCFTEIPRLVAAVNLYTIFSDFMIFEKNIMFLKINRDVRGYTWFYSKLKLVIKKHSDSNYCHKVKKYCGNEIP